MSAVYLVPKWFLISSLFMEIFVILVSLGISFISLKIYSICREREPKLFGFGFLLISLSFIFWFLLNFLLLVNMKLSSPAVDISRINQIGVFLFMSYFFFFILGLTLLAYNTLRARNRRGYAFIALLSFLAVILAAERVKAFYIISGVLFFSLTLHYLFNYIAKRNIKKLINFIAFFLLVISRVGLYMSGVSYLYYVSGHIIEFIAYFLLLLNLLSMMKNEQKKK